MKYKSLQQVYSESVSGNVPPRKHLRVVGETYDVKFKKDEPKNSINIIIDFTTCNFL